MDYRHDKKERAKGENIIRVNQMNQVKEVNPEEEQDFQLMTQFLASPNPMDVNTAILYFTSNIKRVDPNILATILGFLNNNFDLNSETDVEIIESIISFIEAYTKKNTLNIESISQIIAKYKEFFVLPSIQLAIVKNITTFIEKTPESVEVVIQNDYIPAAIQLAEQYLQQNIGKDMVQILIHIMYFLTVLTSHNEVSSSEDYWTSLIQFFTAIINRPIPGPENKVLLNNWHKFLVAFVTCFAQLLDYQASDEFIQAIISIENFNNILVWLMKFEGTSLTASLKLIALLVSRTDEIAALFGELIVSFLSESNIENLSRDQLSFLAIILRNLASADTLELIKAVFFNDATDNFIDLVMSNSKYFSNSEIVAALCSLINTHDEELCSHTLERHPNIVQLILSTFTYDDPDFVFPSLSAVYFLLAYYKSHNPEAANELVDEMFNADIEQAIQFAEENGDEEMHALCDNINELMESI